MNLLCCLGITGKTEQKRGSNLPTCKVRLFFFKGVLKGFSEGNSQKGASRRWRKAGTGPFGEYDPLGMSPSVMSRGDKRAPFERALCSS